MINKSRQGFTLIEILIVVAIIAILASVVLVGLGPTQRAGRDARRLSDLHNIQTGLELYYNKCGYYPGGVANPCAGWAAGTDYAAMVTALKGSGLSINAVPNDPSAGKTYFYGSFTNGSTYTLGADLEDGGNAAFINYVPPLNTVGTGACASPEYCTSL
jgi:general secretion pathway protein G